MHHSHPPRRLAILADGTLDFHHGKTATSLLRYKPQDVVAVIDTEHAGATTGDVLGLGDSIPIVAALEDALAERPDALLIGVAPRGGGLPQEWRGHILSAISHHMEVISGLHYMLNDDPEFAAGARAHGTTLTDVRQPPADLPVAEMKPRREQARVITFVGSDCAVGKMTAALELTRVAHEARLSAAFVATGQTGIMLEGAGIAIDRVIGDFMAGATEQLVVRAAENADWVFVEGQGSLYHPGYSGVTLALLHGSLPDAMILVHQVGHDQIDEYPVKIPPLPEIVKAYEEAARWVKPAPVVAIALNTRGLDGDATQGAIDDAEAQTGLPVSDPVKFGGKKLIEALQARLSPQEAGVPEALGSSHPSR